MENERNNSKFYTLSKEAYEKMENISRLLDKLEKETLNFQKFFHQLDKSKGWKNSQQIIQKQYEIYDFCSAEITSYLRLMDEELISEIFEKVNRGYKIYIKGILQYHHEYLAKNPNVINLEAAQDQSAESTDFANGQHFIKNMRKDVLSISHQLNSKFTDIASILKQKPKPVEKQAELDLLEFMKKVEDERKFQAEKELILKDLDENLDKIKSNVMGIGYSGLQEQLNDMLASTAEAFLRNPIIQESHFEEHIKDPAQSKRKAREMRNGKVKPQRIVEFFEDKFIPNNYEEPVRQSVVVVPKKMAEKYTEMDEEFLKAQVVVVEAKPLEFEDNLFEKLQKARKDMDFFKNQTYELEALNKDLYAEVSKLKTLLLENERKNADLNLQLADLDYQHNQVNKERNELNKNIGILELKLEDVEDEVRRLKYKLDERKKKEEENNKLKMKADEEKDKFAQEAAKENEKLALEITKQRKLRKEAEDTLAILNVNIENQNLLLESKTSEIQSIDAERTILRRRIIGYEAEKKRLEGEIKSLEMFNNFKKRGSTSLKAEDLPTSVDASEPVDQSMMESSKNLSEKSRSELGSPALSLKKNTSSNIGRKNSVKVNKEDAETGKQVISTKNKGLERLLMEKKIESKLEASVILVANDKSNPEINTQENFNSKKEEGGGLYSEKITIHSGTQTDPESTHGSVEQRHTAEIATETTDLPSSIFIPETGDIIEEHNEKTIKHKPRRRRNQEIQTDSEDLWNRLVEEHGVSDKVKSHMLNYLKKNAKGLAISRDNSATKRRVTPLLLDNISFDQGILKQQEFATQKRPHPNQTKNVNFQNISNTPTNDSLHLFTEENSRITDNANEGKKVEKLRKKRNTQLRSLPNFSDHHNENARAMFNRNKISEIMTQKFEASTLISGVSLLGSRPAVLQVENFGSDESEEELFFSKEELMKEVFNSLEVKALRKLSKGKNSGEFMELIKQMIGTGANKKEEDGTLTLPDYTSFKAYFENFLNMHHKCGRNCAHLKRFYLKIGFDYAAHKQKRRQMQLSKLNINKLPRIGGKKN